MLSLQAAARSIDFASDLLDLHSLKLALVRVGCRIGIFIGCGIDPERFLLPMCFPLTEWDTVPCLPLLDPQGQILILFCAPPKTSQEFLYFYFGLLLVCTCLSFNRVFDAEEKPCLGECGLECLFLHSFSSSLTANLRLNCICVVHGHAQSEFSVSLDLRVPTEHRCPLASDTQCFFDHFGGTLKSSEF